MAQFAQNIGDSEQNKIGKKRIGRLLARLLVRGRSIMTIYEAINTHSNNAPIYRVILKKISFVIFTTILVSKEEKNFTKESKLKGLSLSKFS